MQDIHMTIDTNTMVSISEANQNFSKVARLVDEKGSAVILKNNVPRYLVKILIRLMRILSHLMMMCLVSQRN